MDREFEVTLYTRHKLSDPSVMQRVWAYLDTPLVQPTRYDVVERTRHRFSPDAYPQAAKMYGKKGLLLVRGGKRSFLVTFTRERRGLAMWHIALNAGAVKGEDRNLWVRWLLDLCETLPVLYGYACSVEEHKAKHLIVKDLPSGEHFARMRGATVREFFQYLPGVYWLTLFGKELHETFKAQWTQLEGQAIITPLKGEQVAVQLDAPVFPKVMAERLRIERHIADILGTHYFFDQAQMKDVTFQVPPELSEVLGSWYPRLTSESAAHILQEHKITSVDAPGAVGDFMKSTRLGYEFLVAAYLKLGMPVDVQHHQRTALFYAVQYGQPEMIRILTSAGADLEARDPDDDTPLITAADHGDVEILYTLIDLGADVNAVSRKHGTPLIWAILNKRRAFIRPLIAAGAEVNMRYGEHGYTPLYYTLVAKDTQAAMGLVLLGADLNTRFKPHNRSLLTCAILSKQWSIAKVLIVAGADLNATDDLGWTPWYVANYVGWTPWRGLQFQSWDSWTMPEDEKDPEEIRKNLLVSVGLLGWMDWRRYLSAAGVTMEFPPEYDFLKAAESGDLAGVQAALDNGAAINAPDPHGHTALVIAERQGHEDVGRYLRTRGAATACAR